MPTAAAPFLASARKVGKVIKGRVGRRRGANKEPSRDFSFDFGHLIFVFSCLKKFVQSQVGRRLRYGGVGAGCNWSLSCPSLSGSGGGGGQGGVASGLVGHGNGNNNEADWLGATLADWDSPTPPGMAAHYWGICAGRRFFFLPLTSTFLLFPHSLIYSFIPSAGLLLLILFHSRRRWRAQSQGRPGQRIEAATQLGQPVGSGRDGIGVSRRHMWHHLRYAHIFFPSRSRDGRPTGQPEEKCQSFNCLPLCTQKRPEEEELWMESADGQGASV